MENGKGKGGFLSPLSEEAMAITQGLTIEVLIVIVIDTVIVIHLHLFKRGGGRPERITPKYPWCESCESQGQK